MSAVAAVIGAVVSVVTIFLAAIGGYYLASSLFGASIAALIAFAVLAAMTSVCSCNCSERHYARQELQEGSPPA